MTEELAIVDVQALAVRRPPDVVLAEAQKAAAALKAVISAKPNKIMFNGEQYLEFEDWQTVGRFYGVTTKVVRTDFVTFGQVKGFSAHAVALRPDGMEISAAEALCLDDEDKWRVRSKYEWQDGPNGRVKVKTGEEPVPLFQLKSMAQTRACAKAFRNVLAWVVVLAGYRPTPAEELTGAEDGAGPSKAAPAKDKASAPASDGTTTVKSVTVKSGGGGETGKKPWTRYDVAFADGTFGSTFSKSDGEKAQAAQKAGTPVRPKLVKQDKGTDLAGFEEAAAAPKAAEEKPAVPDEPVSGPEKVLTVRKITTDAGPRWAIQTDKRQVVTDKEEFATLAVNARSAGLGVLPTFEVMESPDKSKRVNRLLTLVVASSGETAKAATPAEEPPAEKPKRAPRAKKTREPGEEG